MSEESTNRLGAYLRARRDLVTPERAGISRGTRRRVPGLRREEVATLAGISADYYLRLERGQDTHPSDQVLAALARVLELDDVEHTCLCELAEPARRARPRRRTEKVPARLHQLLDSLGVAAFIEGRAFDVLVANDLARALSPRLQPGENRLRSLLLDPEERAFHDDWEAATEQFVASFRRTVRDSHTDQRVVDLVGEMSLSSARIRWLPSTNRFGAPGSTTPTASGRSPETSSPPSLLSARRSATHGCGWSARPTPSCLSLKPPITRSWATC